MVDFLLDRFSLLGRLDLGLLSRLRGTHVCRTKSAVVRLLALAHLLLDGFEALGDHTGAAPDVSEDALQVLRSLLEGTEPGLQVLGAVALDVLAHPVLAGDNGRGQFRD